MDTYIGTVIPVAFNYAPSGWMFCNGQSLNVNQNAALYALLGFRYGGSGQNFNLPDLRGRTMVGAQGEVGPGLTDVLQGQMIGSNTVQVNGSGTSSVTLSVANLPPHTHTLTIPAGALGATSTLNVSATTAVGATKPTPGVILSGSANSGALQAGIYYTGTPALPALPTLALHPASVSTTVSGTTTLTSSSVGSATAVSIPVTSTATVSVMQPSVGMNYIICTIGYYPTRN